MAAVQSLAGSEAGQPLARSELLLAFGARVKALRISAGMRQEDLAVRSGLDRIAISQIERGRREVGMTRLVALAAALGVRPGQLVDEGSGPATGAASQARVTSEG